jgi:hypothetical protein
MWLALENNWKAKQMLVFIDTEFTNHVKPDLISVGLAAIGGKDFYVERTDYRFEHCTDFVLAEIVPLLGRVPGAACTAPELANRLRLWFDALPEPATIIYDFETDWQLLQEAFAGALPRNIDGHELVDHKMFRHSAYKLGEIMVYSAAWPPHHALADAQALREGYLRWIAATKGRDPTAAL